MVLEAAAKPRSWVPLLVKALGLAILALALLVLPSRAFAGRLVERLDVFANVKKNTSLKPLRSWRQVPPPLLELAQTAAAKGQPQLVQPPAASAAPPKRNISCQLVPKNSPFDWSCKRLEDACVDQGRLILYGQQYRPRFSNGPPVGLPVLKPAARSRRFYFPYWHEDTKDMKAGAPPIHVRAPSSREPRRYLDVPSFSQCTVPIVFYQHNPFNFAHVLRDNAARMHSALQETAWADHARLVIMTGEGLPVSSMALGLWQPLSKMRVDSWAEFSVRLPDGQASGKGSKGEWAAPGAPPPSFEGSEQRCFKHMYVCLNDVHPTHVRVHDFGQFLARYYGGPQNPLGAEASAMPARPPSAARQPRLEQKVDGRRQQQSEEQQQQQLTQLPPVSAIRQLGALPQTAQKQQGRELQLRVLFSKRSSGDRRLLNTAELLRRCNAWRYTAPSGAQLRALCWEAETPSLKAGIAAAQQADVLIGPHGANLANAYFMRPGSSVIELTMHGFEGLGTDSAHANFARRNYIDDASQLQWWKLLLCAPDSWRPGTREAKAMRQGKPVARDAPKWRDLVVRWPAIETALRAAVDTAGDMAAYRHRFERGRWMWLSTANSTVPAGRDLRQTCQKAQAEGRIP
ncbi:hypothetical protein ABPG77_007255 [Micractinium sp. CCAP 211/92]